jgi:hypothetical protein
MSTLTTFVKGTHWQVALGMDVECYLVIDDSLVRKLSNEMPGDGAAKLQPYFSASDSA